MGGRYLEVTLSDPFSNVALEEVLFDGLRVPTLRVWGNQPSVIIGRAQLARFETDLEMCQKDKIPVVRRFTAGGAVYNGPGNLNWSFYVPRSSDGPGTGLFSANRVFATFAQKVVTALAACGVQSEFRAPNGIFSHGGKVSGMAAYISRRAVLCHGTLLLDADLGEVRRLTSPSAEVLLPRYPRSRDGPVANCGVRSDHFARCLFDASGFDLSADHLSAAEEEAATGLGSSKYADERWNLGDPFALDDL